MAKLTIKDYQIILENKNNEIELLKHRLKNFETLQLDRCCACEKDAIQRLSDQQFSIMTIEEKIEKLKKEVLEILNK